MQRFGIVIKKKPKAKRKQSVYRSRPARETAYYRTVILGETLAVAAIAIAFRVYEPIVWAFLSVVAGYAALTKTRF